MSPREGHRNKLKPEDFIHKYFSDAEWNADQHEDSLSEAKSIAMHQHISAEIQLLAEQKKQKRLKLVRAVQYLSAASIVFLIGIVLYVGLNNSNNKADRKSATADQLKPVSKEKSTWQEIVNNGQSLKSFRLPDSSLITIYPHSTIRFERLFDQKLRNVYLQGKAKFKVKRNTARPFSVYSGNLKTTALGTSFTISTRGRRISVKLHTGKIVIANVKTQVALAYISTPGATLLYHPSLNTVSIIKPALPKKALPELLKTEGTVITMKNIPLPKVIELLNHAYGITVSADQAVMAKITFTGKVDTGKEQAEDVLKLICLINNMTLSKVTDNTYLIQKSN